MAETPQISNDEFLKEFDALVNTALLRHNLIHINVDNNINPIDNNQQGSSSSSSSSTSSSSSGICDSSHSSFVNYKQRLDFNHEFSESFKVAKNSSFVKKIEPLLQTSPIQSQPLPISNTIPIQSKAKPKTLNKKPLSENTSNNVIIKHFNTKTNLKGNLLDSQHKTNKFSTSTLRRASNSERSTILKPIKTVKNQEKSLKSP